MRAMKQLLLILVGFSLSAFGSDGKCNKFAAEAKTGKWFEAAASCSFGPGPTVLKCEAYKDYALKRTAAGGHSELATVQGVPLQVTTNGCEDFLTHELGMTFSNADNLPQKVRKVFEGLKLTTSTNWFLSEFDDLMKLSPAKAFLNGGKEGSKKFCGLKRAETSDAPCTYNDSSVHGVTIKKNKGEVEVLISFSTAA